MELSASEKLIQELGFRLIPLQLMSNVAGIQAQLSVPLAVIVEQSGFHGGVGGQTIADKYHALLWAKLEGTRYNLDSMTKRAALLANTMPFLSRGYTFSRQRYKENSTWSREEWAYHLIDPWGRMHKQKVPTLREGETELPVVPLGTPFATAPDTADEEKVAAAVD